MLPTILKYRLRQTHNTLVRSPGKKKLGWLISIAFITPYYMMLIGSMRMIYGGVYANSGWQPLAQLVSVNFAMIFFFVLVSTAALTLYKMFQSKDLPLLMSLPARDKSLFWARLVESLMDAGRSMILPLPFCLAFVSVMPPLPAIVFLIGWFAIMFQLAGLSIIIALVLGRIIIASRWAILLRIVAVVAALAFLLIAMGYVQRAGSDISIGTQSASLSRFVSLSAFFPTSWLVAFLFRGDSTVWAGLLYGLGFAAATICCPIAAFYFFKRRFRRLWMMTMEVKQRKRTHKTATDSVSAPMGNTQALILKEARVFRREPHVWIGLVIPLVLFPVFIFFRAHESGTQAIYIFVVSLLTTASYSLPCVGREGVSFSLLRSLPVRMSLLLRAKLLLGCAVNLAVTLAFVIALYLARRSSLDQTLYNGLIAIIISIYLPAFGTALAALFPKFDFANPMKAASLPGLLMLYLIVFLFGITFIGTITAGWYFAPLVLLPWAGIAFVLMKVGQDRLEKMDI